MRARITIRDARPEERAALEALQRRSSDVWEEYRAQLAAHPDAIELAAQAIAERRVTVAVGAGGELLGFSVLDPVRDGACELDGLFVGASWSPTRAGGRGPPRRGAWTSSPTRARSASTSASGSGRAARWRRGSGRACGWPWASDGAAPAPLGFRGCPMTSAPS
jgi:hypothetical protein